MDYILDHLKLAGILRIAISTSYLAELIEEYYGDGSGIGMEISYLREEGLMGTAGWMKFVDWDLLADHFLVLNADNLFWIDIPKFVGRHISTNAIATIAGIEIPSETAVNYELLAANGDRTRLFDYVDRKLSEPLRQAVPSVFVSSGWYVMTPAVRQFVSGELPLSLESHIWPALAKSGVSLGFYHATEPWFDSGTHERLARVEEFLQNYDKSI